MNAKAVNAKAIELCKLVTQMTTHAGAGHPSSALSLAHLVTILMHTEMRHDPRNPWHHGADRLVLSEGHAVPIIYAAYADLGGTVGRDPTSTTPLSIKELEQLREWNSVLDGHPNPAEGFPFFDAATGSLGMGLSVAAGLAIAARLDKSDRRIYCLLGDGESREGQISEAFDFIADRKLTNLCAIINCNGEGQAGPVSAQQSPEIIQRKLTAFGWQSRIIDGHDPTQIFSALKEFHSAEKPFAIIARTVKGWGVKPLQGGNFHGKPLPEDKLPAAFDSLDQMHDQLGTTAADASPLRPPAPQATSCEREIREIKLPPFEEAAGESGFSAALKKKKLATRRGYGIALNILGQVDGRVVALDGDVSNSTYADIFAQNHPDRFFECKIAEQNMVSTAVGLAGGGKIPFVSSFAKFIARAYDQVELACISRSNIKLIGSHAGLGPASDGPSQMALADLSFFRGLCNVDDGTGRPACRIFLPADAVAAYRCTELMANIQGLCYMRTHRPDVPFVYSFDEQFEVGGSKILRQGQAATIIASGYMVTEAIKACNELARKGIECTLIDAYCLPLKMAPILQAADKTNNLIVTAEDNYSGGVGSAVAEEAAGSGQYRVHQILVKRIPKSARKPEELMDKLGVSSRQICERVQQLCSTPS